MALVSYDVIFPLCLVELPGCPAPVVTGAINNAAIRLCNHAQCWQEWQDVALESGESSYDLYAPASAMVTSILSVLYSGTHFRPTTQAILAAGDGGFLDRAGTPASYWINETGGLRLYPIPQAEDAGRIAHVQTAFAPTTSATGCDGRIVALYGDVLSSGAKAALMRMPGQSWSNPELSMFYLREFMAGMDRARIDALHDGTNSSARVMPRRFGG